MITFERETNEFQPVAIAVDGAPPAGSIDFAIVVHGARPTTWVPAVETDEGTGFWIQSLTAGMYEVYVRVTTLDESMVRMIGHMKIR